MSVPGPELRRERVEHRAEDRRRLLEVRQLLGALERAEVVEGVCGVDELSPGAACRSSARWAGAARSSRPHTPTVPEDGSTPARPRPGSCVTIGLVRPRAVRLDVREAGERVGEEGRRLVVEREVAPARPLVDVGAPLDPAADELVAAAADDEGVEAVVAGEGPERVATSRALAVRGAAHAPTAPPPGSGRRLPARGAATRRSGSRRCAGVSTRFGACSSGLSAGSGSSQNTSSAAPASFPLSSARSSAVLVDEPAARRVDEERAVAHEPEGAVVHHPLRLGDEPVVQRDDVRPGEQVLERGVARRPGAPRPRAGAGSASCRPPARRTRRGSAPRGGRSARSRRGRPSCRRAPPSARGPSS